MQRKRITTIKTTTEVEDKREIVEAGLTRSDNLRNRCFMSEYLFRALNIKVKTSRALAKRQLDNRAWSDRC
jgi:hypothetical protein